MHSLANTLRRRRVPAKGILLPCAFCLLVSFFVVLIWIPPLATSAESVPMSANPLQEMLIWFFYDNPCESCRTEEKFIARVGSAMDALDLDDRVKYRVSVYMTIRAEDRALLERAFLDYHVPAEKQFAHEFVFAGGSWLAGEDIEAGLESLLETESKDMILRPSVEATRGPSPSSPILPVVLRTLTPSNDTWIYYFYTSPCANCERVDPFLSSLESQVIVDADGVLVPSEVRIIRKNIADPDALVQAQRFFAAWGVPTSEQKVPVAFTGTRFFSGSEQILNRLTGSILAGEGRFTVEVDGVSLERALTGYEIAGVFATGLLNGFNPCSLSMLLFFLSLLLSKGTSILKAGLFFIFGKGVAYVVLGAGAYRLLQLLEGTWVGSLQDVFRILLVVMFVVLAGGNLADFIIARNERYERIRMQLPVFLRKFNHAWLKRLATSATPSHMVAGAFLAGFLVSVGEFLCTGQIYLATLLYIMHETGAGSVVAAGYCLLYVLGILLPLLGLTWILHRGKNLFLVTESVRSKLPEIKLATAAIFFGFAVLFVLTF